MSNENPFEGTPVGGTPHWYGRPRPPEQTVGHHVRDIGRGAVEVGAVSAGLTYWASRDSHKAVQAATWGVGMYLALIPTIALATFSLLFLPLALLAHAGGTAFVLLILATLGIVLSVVIVRRTWARGQRERWFVNDNN